MRKLAWLSSLFIAMLIASCGGSSNCETSALLLGVITSASCKNSKDSNIEASAGDVFESFKANAIGGYTLVSNTIDDDTYGSGSGCGFQASESESYDKKAMESDVKLLNGSVTISTSTKWCAELDNYKVCLAQFDKLLILDRITNEQRHVEIYMTGLVEDAITYTDFTASYGSSIESRSKVTLPSNISSCPDLATQSPTSKDDWSRGSRPSGFPNQPSNALDGNWTGYKASYSTSSEVGTTAPASLTCVNQSCTVSDPSNAVIELQQQSGGGAWKTAVNAPKVAGAALSGDRRLLSLFLCNKPFLNSQMLDTCSFYTLKR
jgi:hypothetical protein